MKIAIIPGAFFPDPGGAQVQAHNLANFFQEKHKVDVFLLKKTNIKKKNYKIKYLDKFTLNVVYILNYYFDINIDFILTFYLKNIIKKNKYDVWHFIFLNYKSLILINSLKKLNQKIVITFQGADIQINKSIGYGNRLDKKYDKFLKKIIKSGCLFTSISKNILEDLIKLNINKKRITIIPNGIPIEKFKKYKPNKNKKNKKNKKIKFITVARYSLKKKGYDILPKIAQKIIDKNIDFEWTIIGKNTSLLLKNDTIFNNKEKFKIYENIDSKQEFYFPNSKIIKLYNQSDLYINLSRIESFGITFVESLAANVPLITFDTKGANELVKNNKTGFIINSGAYDVFVKKVALIYRKPKLFKNNPFKYAQKFSIESLSEQYINTYKLKKKTRES